jgi:nicotinamide-nucleotide amidase
MAEGVKRISNSTLGIAITGVAGAERDVTEKVPKVSGPSSLDKPVGTLSFAIAGPKTTRAETKLFSGGRERIRRAAAYYALDLARRYISK